jgi:uncharacterized membrane protein
MAELLLLALTVLIWLFLCHLQHITFLSFSAKTIQENHEFLLPAFIAGYLSLVMAAILTAVEFGIQPLIASLPMGKRYIVHMI